ncbi:MAG: YwiC-like family protein [Bacteroidota bacterium]|nr:YwiC-like family protein [Bacteroidota bacterium]
MNFPKPIITREHGSWAVLFVPMLIGVVYAGSFSINILLLACSALGIFLSYAPIHSVLREFSGISQGNEKVRASIIWAIIYVFAGILFIIPLFLQGYYHLIAFAVLGATSFFGNYFLTIKIQKSIVSDLIAIAGLTLSAPSAYYIATGLFDVNGAVLWILNFLFFGCSVFYVHMKIKVSALKKDRLPLREKLTLGKLNILYHLFVVSVVIILSLYHYTPLTATLAFVPMFVHAIYGTMNLSGSIKFKKLGILLLAQSILFGVVLVFVWS